MHLHLKTKITLIVALLVLAVVGVNSWLYLATLTKQVIRQADNRADLVAQQVFFQAQNALADAATKARPRLPTISPICANTCAAHSTGTPR